MSVVLELEQLRDSVALVRRAFSTAYRTKAEQSRTILTDSNFLLVLEAALASGKECIAREARDFLLQCLTSGRISSHALISLSLKHFPERKEPRRAVWGRGSGLAQLLLSLHKLSPQKGLLVEAAAADGRILPHLLQCAEINLENEPFFAFLLGDPDLNVGVMSRMDSTYLQTRIALVSRLACEFHMSSLAGRLLVSFMVWNGSKPCLSEAYALWPLCKVLACPASWPESQRVEMTDAALCFFEYLCQVYYDINEAEFMLTECLKILAQLAQLPDPVVFQLTALLMTRSVGVELFQHAVDLIQLKIPLMAQVLCAKHAISLSSYAQNLSTMRTSFEPVSESKLFIHDEMPQMKPFTIVGHLASQLMRGWCSDLSYSTSCNHDLNRLCFFLILTKDMEAGRVPTASWIVSALSSRLAEFNEIFLILASAEKMCSIQADAVVSVMIDLVTSEVANESQSEQRLRISWILDYFEECCGTEDLKGLLPRLAFDASSNLIFAYVQRKLPFLLSLDGGQFPYFATLCGMLRVSETRQSRLQFIVTSALSWLASVASGKILVVECRALSLAFQVLSCLARLAVLDPRPVWIKYSAPLLLRLGNTEPVTYALASFISAFKAVSRSKDGQIDAVVSEVLSWLVNLLGTTQSLKVFDAACKALASLDIECLKETEYNRLVKMLPAVDEKGDPVSYETTQVLSESLLFNAESLWSLCNCIGASKLASFRLLWTTLVDFEVANMSRQSFLGTGPQLKSVSSPRENTILDLGFMANTSSHASFCAHILRGPNAVRSITELSAFIASDLRALILGIPLASQMSWLLRPHLAVHIRAYHAKLLAETDDVALLRKLSNYTLVLEETKTWPATPQVSSGIVMATSGLVRVLYDRGFINQKVICEGWLSKLLGNWQDVARCSCLSANDDFIAAVIVSLFIFADVSKDIRQKLDAHFSCIISDPKWKDASVAVFAAIEHLSESALVDLVNQPKTSSKRRLCALQALFRFENRVALIAQLDASLTLDPILTLGFMALGEPQLDCASIPSTMEPLEFKGVRSIAVGMAPSSEAAEMAKRNAFATTPIPSAFKLESIITYAVMAGFNFFEWRVDKARSQLFLADLKQIASTTTDAKCCSLIHALAVACANAAQVEPDRKSDSSNQLSAQLHLALLLEKIRSREEPQFCIDVLAGCRLLPRLNWEPLDLDPLSAKGLILKHVVSLTPLTNTHHISPSLKTLFVRLLNEKESIAGLELADKQRFVETTTFILSADEAWSLLGSLPMDQALMDVLVHILSTRRIVSELSPELCEKMLSLVLAFSLKTGQVEGSLTRLLEGTEYPALELKPELASAARILRLGTKAKLLPVLKELDSYTPEARKLLFNLLKRKLLVQSSECVNLLCELLDALLIRVDDHESKSFLAEAFLGIATSGSGELDVFALNLAAAEFGQSDRLRNSLLRADFLPAEFYGIALAAYEARYFAEDVV